MGMYEGYKMHEKRRTLVAARASGPGFALLLRDAVSAPTWLTPHAHMKAVASAGMRWSNGRSSMQVLRRCQRHGLRQIKMYTCKGEPPNVA